MIFLFLLIASCTASTENNIKLTLEYFTENDYCGGPANDTRKSDEVLGPYMNYKCEDNAEVLTTNFYPIETFTQRGCYDVSKVRIPNARYMTDGKWVKSIRISWTGDCIGRRCPAHTFEGEGFNQHVPKTKTGEMVRIDCLPGFEKPTGLYFNYVDCNWSGEWSHDTISCEKSKQCPSLTISDYGVRTKYLTESAEGSVETLFCDYGFTGTSVEITCKNAEWSSERPSCIKNDNYYYYDSVYDYGLSTGAIVGIVAGCVVFVTIISIIVYFCCCKTKKHDEANVNIIVPQPQPVHYVI